MEAFKLAFWIPWTFLSPTTLIKHNNRTQIFFLQHQTLLSNLVSFHEIWKIYS